MARTTGDAELATARALPEERDRDPVITWIKRGGFAFALVAGCVFILWANHFHVTTPVVIICLAYLAVLATVVNLWSSGVSAAKTQDPRDAWGRPLGERDFLEKEKRTLLKAIREAEVDYQMGKLSKADADEMIQNYRARAIEVIKQLDAADSDAAASVRDKIAREIAARLQVDKKRPKVGKEGGE